MSNRLRFWQDFAGMVDEHIEEYTVPQYGDYPEDQLMDFEVRDIIKNMQRYLNRFESGARGIDETKRDCFKLAHYSSELWARVEGIR